MSVERGAITLEQWSGGAALLPSRPHLGPQSGKCPRESRGRVPSDRRCIAGLRRASGRGQKRSLGPPYSASSADNSRGSVGAWY